MKTVVAVHTAMPMVEPTKALFSKHLPNIRLINIVDDSLIQDVIKAGKVPVEVRKRLMCYYQAAVDTGANAIFNTCSSIGDVAIIARDFLPIPLIKIDDAMAIKAVEEYDRIGVLATLPTTLSPTIKLVERMGIMNSKRVQIAKGLAEGAFEAMMSGDNKTHDEIILKTAVSMAKNVEVFVLAQGSMARMAEQLSKETGKPVLSSPELGVLNVKDVLSKL